MNRIKQRNEKAMKRNGKGAVCTVITRLLHPRKEVTDKYPNAGHNSKVKI